MLSDGSRWRARLLTQALVIHAAWSIFRLIIVLRAIASGADAVFLGVLSAAMAVSALLVALPAGRRTDRVPPGGFIVLGFAMGAAGAATAIFVAALPGILAVAVLLGVAQILIMIGQQSYLAQRTTRGESDGDFAALTLAASVGQLAGPVFIGGIELLADVGEEARLGIDFALVAVLLVVGLALRLPSDEAPAAARSRPRSPAAEEDSRAAVEQSASGALNGRRAGSGLWRPIFVSAVVLGALDLLFIFIPLWAAERDVDNVFVAALFAVRAAVSIAGRVGLTRIVAWAGRRGILLITLGIGGVSMAAFPFADEVWIWLVIVGLGIVTGVPQPLTMSWTVVAARPGRVGEALGYRLAANRLGQIAIPLVAGAVAGVAGIAPAMLIQAALLLAAAAASRTADEARPRDDPPL